MSSLTTLGAGPSAAYSDPYADYLVYDTFTDDDGTLLDAHTPDKDTEEGGWVFQNGEWQIKSNEAIPTALWNNQRAWVTIDSGDATPEVQTDIVLGASYNAGCVFRMTDLSNFLEVCLIESGSNIEVWKCDGGGWSKIANDGNLYSGTITLNVIIDSNSLYTITVDDVEELTVTDAFNDTETSHGMRPFETMSSSHDYFWVKA